MSEGDGEGKKMSHDNSVFFSDLLWRLIVLWKILILTKYSSTVERLTQREQIRIKIFLAEVVRLRLTHTCITNFVMVCPRIRIKN